MNTKTTMLLSAIAVVVGLQIGPSLAQGAAGLSNMPNDAYANAAVPSHAAGAVDSARSSYAFYPAARARVASHPRAMAHHK
jgi:hypothetical protein